MSGQSQRKGIDKAFLLDTILNTTNELIVIVDQEGYIEEISQPYAEFIGVKKDKVIGVHVTEVIENTKMDIVAKTGIPEIETIQKINGQKMIATRLPIMKDGKVVGAFGRVLFKNVMDLNNLYEKINKMETELDLYKMQFGKINTAKYTVDDIVGDSQLMTSLKDTINTIARTNSSVLILGESGTGKELFAHAIHHASNRARQPFICLNCGTIPADLIESELFGYEEGSFTGARKGGKVGMFQAAHKGTIFLDEIGDLPMPMQVKLLRVLQDREIQKIGSNHREAVDVRVIAATNKDPYQMVQENQFRSDLYYRLNVISLRIPALRERKEDIPILAKAFIKKLAQKENITVDKITDSALEYLKHYDWPGNVRELENIMERAINFLGNDKVIRAEHLPKRITGISPETESKSLREILEETERLAIVDALLSHGGQKTIAARSLEISRTSLYEKMQKYHIDASEKEQMAGKSSENQTVL
ncbi:sigma-54 interaction domain-containing protein [Sinanaerobacter chloroacetimidivorans]|uniref:Sigma 54-interacting transcriptional regulator n=1 Tax=Sinanaerobacter chloroacetimidivorans TaxID=2818044 RepID=A0A8J8B246_9FIRM|nr:sigma 54-interacting transcriptional regulator [Sinanaerobacter chloroacetimidivorans]MBR0599408.1 sigma 54-interacting transcriptional regulator [Sinanaerobacter chloroacetimidivorans]